MTGPDGTTLVNLGLEVAQMLTNIPEPVSAEDLHRAICGFIIERQQGQAEALRLIADRYGMLPAIVNLALIEAGLAPFEQDEWDRLLLQSQQQLVELQEQVRRMMRD